MGVICLKVKYTSINGFTMKGVKFYSQLKFLFNLTEFFGQPKHNRWRKIFSVFLLHSKQKQPWFFIYLFFILFILLFFF